MVHVDLEKLEFANRNCPLCDAIEFKLLARNDRNLLGISTVGCRHCGLVQTNPRPSAVGLDRFYRDHYRLFYQGATTPDLAYISSLNKDVRLAYTARFFSQCVKLKPDSVVLDFGCGEGSLFAALRKAGFIGSFYGVELNSSFGEYASRFGNATVSNKISSREPVDLVIVNHVLEHLSDPVGVLMQLGNLLKKDGRLYVDVPDVDEYDGIKDLHIAHIYHFSERTLSKLVSRAGFELELVERHRPPYHPPSIRLVARFTGNGMEVPALSSLNERPSWAAVRYSGRYLNTIPLRLRRNPYLRFIYFYMRNIIKRGSGD